jgi:hypothetical protein
MFENIITCAPARLIADFYAAYPRNPADAASPCCGIARPGWAA